MSVVGGRWLGLLRVLYRVPRTPSIPRPLLSPQAIATRSFAARRTRKKFVDVVKVKHTKSTKKEVEFYKDMTAKDLSEVLGVPFDDVVEVLVDIDRRNLEVASDPDGVIDQESTLKTIAAFNCKPKLVSRPSKEQEKSDDLLPQPPASPSSCTPRPPVVTIMGHVDHGKTTLLDALRNSRIVDGEFGGITQHIGAFSVLLPKSGRRVTFLDTPGHAAFAAMRARGAAVTDIVVLVVAADDGAKEQTVQSIRFARESGVSIVLALNKCDKPTADPSKALRSLLEHDIVAEEMGGDIQCVQVSALYGKGLNELQEAILLQADLLDLKAPEGGLVEGHIIESSVETGLGKVCTVLVYRGTLKKGRILVAGTAWTRVKTMTDDAGKEIPKAGPGTAVRVSGWKDDLPSPGDIVLEASDTSRAQKAIVWRERREMEKKAEKDWDEIEEKRNREREEYLGRRQRLLEAGRRYGSTLRAIAHKEQRYQKDVGEEEPTLRIILRCDVEGTLEAILEVISSYTSDKVDLQLVDFGVGPPNEKDIELAQTSGAVIYTFNVTPSHNVKQEAKKNTVEIKPFNVVYRLVDQLKEDLSEKLPTTTELELVGQGHILKEFLISDRARKRQPIAGVLVDWGNFEKNCIFRFSRGSEVFYEGPVESMKAGIELVSIAKTNTEVGLALADKNIRFKEDDSLEVFEKKVVVQKIDWFPPGF